VLVAIHDVLATDPAGLLVLWHQWLTHSA
jgi:hypothetical protein